MLSKSRNNSAQSSIEFILIFGLLLIILAIAVNVAWVRIYGISNANRNLEVSKVLDDVSNKINLAFLEGDGFSINLEVPNSLFGQNYTIEIHRNNVVIYYLNSTYSSHLLTENITGTIHKGDNKILNSRGEIVIT